MLSTHIDILISAFALGLLGSGHCLAMCGGLSTALGLSLETQRQSKISIETSDNLLASDKTQNKSTTRILAYHLGRLTSYALAGVSVGLIGFWFSEYLDALTFLRALAALMLILMGLYLGSWFNGLVLTEKLGAKLWQVIRPLGKKFLRPKTPYQAFGLGLVWGWLPCGLVYSALIWASSEADIMRSALVMLCFGLGTLPSMLSASLFSESLSKWLRHDAVRKVSGLAFIAYGLWSAYALT
jgi:sulfite exporter TauE/SafE